MIAGEQAAVRGKQALGEGSVRSQIEGRQSSPGNGGHFPVLHPGLVSLGFCLFLNSAPQWKTAIEIGVLGHCILTRV